MSKYAAQKWRELALAYEQRPRNLIYSTGVFGAFDFVLGLCEISSEPWNFSLWLLEPQKEDRVIDYLPSVSLFKKQKGSGTLKYLPYWWDSFSCCNNSWDERATACALLAAIEEDEG